MTKSVLEKGNLITNSKPIMGSEDFSHLILDREKTKSTFLFIGTANPQIYEQSIESGKQFPFYNHNGKYMVDLSAIPLGVEVGSTALISLFNK